TYKRSHVLSSVRSLRCMYGKRNCRSGSERRPLSMLVNRNTVKPFLETLPSVDLSSSLPTMPSLESLAKDLAYKEPQLEELARSIAEQLRPRPPSPPLVRNGKWEA